MYRFNSVKIEWPVAADLSEPPNEKEQSTPVSFSQSKGDSGLDRRRYLCCHQNLMVKRLFELLYLLSFPHKHGLPEQDYRISYPFILIFKENDDFILLKESVRLLGETLHYVKK